MDFGIFTHKNKRIYLDYAALAPLHPDIREQSFRYSKKGVFNHESLYNEGVSAAGVINSIEKNLWNMYSMHADEVIFTESGTLSNNLAIQGVIKYAKQSGISKPHVIISSIEHSSVLETVVAMVRQGEIDADYLEISHEGKFDEKLFKQILRPETVLVSCIYVNNETGLVLPVFAVEKIIRHYRKIHKTSYPYFHSDCAQAMYFDIDMRKFHADLITITGSKMFGGQGVSVLYVRRGVNILPIIYGGDGKKVWSGTKNMLALFGYNEVLVVWDTQKHIFQGRVKNIHVYVISELLLLQKEYPEIEIISNPCGEFQSPHIVNFGIKNSSGERSVILFDAKGICVSSKSACKSNDDGVSHVIESFYKNSGSDYKNLGVIRISFGFRTHKKEIDIFFIKLKEILKLYRLEQSMLYHPQLTH